ncbi:MAG: hypothetical protein U0Q07_14265 [Acidimicrobiales bacterium]
MPAHPEVWRPLIGLPCLEIVWDPISGALLELGRRVRLPEPINNDALTLGQRNFKGTQNLFIQSCPWQLERGEEAMEGWDSIDLLRGEVITHVSEFARGDVTISWSNDLRLLLWASLTTRGTCYSVKVGESWWRVEAGEELRRST